MKIKISAQNPLLCSLLAFALVFAVPGCRSINRKLNSTSAEGVEQKSYNIPMYGYQQTATIKANPQELAAFLNDPGNWFSLAGMEIKTDNTIKKQASKKISLGATFPFEVGRQGIKISGRMIVVRNNDEELWMVFDNPRVVHLQRWTFKQTKEGVRTTISVSTGTQDSELIKLVGEKGAADIMNEAIGRMMANLQARFDSSIKVEELISRGLAGESYEGLFMAQEASIPIDASPEKMEKWMSVPKNMVQFMREFNFDEKHYTDFFSSSVGDVTYTAGRLETGIFKIKMDTFSVRREKSSETRMYILAMGQMGFSEFHIMPEAGGTKLTLKLIGEVPESSSGEMIGVMFYASGFPKFVQERLLEIKKGVEKGLLR